MTTPTPDLPPRGGSYRWHTADESDDSITARFRDLFGVAPARIIRTQHYAYAGPVPEPEPAVGARRAVPMEVA